MGTLQEAKEPLDDPETGRHRAGGEVVAERRLNPAIDIGGRGLGQVRIERGLPGLGHEARKAFEGADRAFLHGRRIVTRTQVGEIVKPRRATPSARLDTGTSRVGL